MTAASAASAWQSSMRRRARVRQPPPCAARPTRTALPSRTRARRRRSPAAAWQRWPRTRAALQAESATVRQWLAGHEKDARAQLLAGIICFDLAERPDAGRRAEPYLRRAVVLDPNLTSAWLQLRALYEQQPDQLARHLE